MKKFIFVTQFCISLLTQYVGQVGEAIVSHLFYLQLDSIFSGKIRVKLLTKLLLNPASKVYLRGLERELGVSSNTVRLELNKLNEMHLIKVQVDPDNTKVKHYAVNTAHPMFSSLRGIIMQFVGLDQIIEQVIDKLGNVEKVYLTGDLAEGKDSPFVDLVLIGDVDKDYLYQLIQKAEGLIPQKKIRVAVYASREQHTFLDNFNGPYFHLLN